MQRRLAKQLIGNLWKKGNPGSYLPFDDEEPIMLDLIIAGGQRLDVFSANYACSWERPDIVTRTGW